MTHQEGTFGSVDRLTKPWFCSVLLPQLSVTFLVVIPIQLIASIDQSTAKVATDGNHTNGNYSSNDEKPIEFHQNGGDSTRDMATEALERIRTTGSITMTPEQFERLYLQPQGQVKGELRKTFGNPTPLAIGGFVMALMPLSCQLLGWRGSTQLGAATSGFLFFIGGPCLWLGGILEFFLGNTFSFIVFFIYGGILFGWAATLQPYFDTAGAFAPPTGNYQTQNQEYRAGIMEGPFWSSLAFQPLAAGMLSLVFLVGALRVNIVFVLVFFTVSIGFLTLSASFWKMGLGEMILYERLLEATGGFWFFTSLLGWYLLFVQVMDAVGFTWPLPVGDLSGYWAKREKTKKPAGDQV